MHITTITTDIITITIVAIRGTTATRATTTAAIPTMGMAITIARAGGTTTMAIIIIEAGATSITIAATIIATTAVKRLMRI